MSDLGVIVGLNQLLAEVGHVAQALCARANLVTGFLLGGALVINKLCARKVAASLRLLLFAAVFARLALPVGWTTPLGLLGHAAVAPGTAVAAVDGGTLLLAAAPDQPGGGLGFWLGLFYALGVAALLGRWIHARWALARQLRSARPTGLTAGADLAVAEHATLGPLVAGILRPRIVMPAALIQRGDAEALGFVLAHEAAHVARRDHWLVAAVQLMTIVAWPVLPLWFAARQIRSLCELACDERVLAGRTPEQRRRYGEILLQLSDGDLALAPAGLSPSFAWDLRGRLLALRRSRRWHAGAQWGLVATGAGLLLACSGAPEDASGTGVEINAPVLNVTPRGTLVLDGQEVERDNLESKLRGALAAAGSETLRIRDAAMLEKVTAVPIMSVAKRAGATKILLLPGASAIGRVCPPDQLCGVRGPWPPPESAAGNQTPVPQPSSGAQRGSLDKSIIRDVLRGHMPEIKACYEAVLGQRPGTPGGRMMIALTIGRDGKVSDSGIEESTVADPAVGQCIAKAARGWVFPAPDGGIVVVRYPVLLQARHEFTPPGPGAN